jgi:hypothetical protein
VAVAGITPLKVIAGAAVMVTVTVAEAVSLLGDPESVIVNVALKVPAQLDVTVPVIKPEPLRVRQGGSDPLVTAQVYGDIPPLPASCTL